MDGRERTKHLLTEMMREALKASHRRLLVISGKDSEDVITFLILKHRELNGKSGESVVYAAPDEKENSDFESLLEKLEENGFPTENVKFHTYVESDRLLGTTNDILILDMSLGARPNDIGRLVETVRGGGLIILYNLDLSVEKPWDTSIHRSFLTPPYCPEDIHVRFEKYFVRKILETRSVWILDGWQILKGELLNVSQKVKKSLSIPERSRVPKKIHKLVLTQDQAEALHKLEEVIHENGRSVLIIISNRGRGKSALLGLGAVTLLSLGASRILITAPGREEVQVVFDMIEKGLKVLNKKFTKKYYAGWISRIKSELGVIDFSHPYKALNERADVLMVDEAAGIPVPLLFKLTQRFPKAIFASTIHGYEGAGRGFSLRFLKTLEESKEINLHRIEMDEPIRYANGDPVEDWLYKTLLLDAEPAEIGGEKVNLENCIYGKADLDLWFEKAEKELREFIGIYVLAHYRNRPDDLLILGDAPHHSARFVKTNSGRIVAALHLAEEGEMPEEVINLVLDGSPPSGNLIPSCVVKYYPPYRDFAKFRGLRIVRIAVHPDLIGRGLGSFALKNLCDEAEKEGFDWVGAGFGADRQLLNFWLKNGFIPVHISPMRNIVSGEFSVVVVKPLNKSTEDIIQKIYREFKVRFLESLPDTYYNLDSYVAAQLLSVQRWSLLEPPHLTSSQHERLLKYTQGVLAYEAACDSVRKVLQTHFLSSGELRCKLDLRTEAELISRCLQCRSWDKTAEIVKIHPVELKSDLRLNIGRLAAHYEAAKL
ncbi:tRNA(Met) cytidine acetyltransferase [Candidatus Bathyarchaeota archaeon]|nr:MAG: tRNA(Met) cytidine acetyltransferase [Candidatus Bathyarchaeota archaeon]